MARIALYTFGILKGAYQSEALTEFAGMARMIFPTLGGADGFIAQAGDARPDLLGRAGHGEDFGPWGVYVAPRFFDARWQASGASPAWFKRCRCGAIAKPPAASPTMGCIATP